MALIVKVGYCVVPHGQDQSGGAYCGESSDKAISLKWYEAYLVSKRYEKEQV